MEKQYKYTVDGKKVVIIGNLNSNEKIVQEIFVSGESEIPAGEHFIVKSLLDSPALSWKQDQLNKLEKRYSEDSVKYEKLIDDLRKKYQSEKELFMSKLDFFTKSIKHMNPGMFNTLVDYLNGNIKYCVEHGYTPKLIKWEDFNEKYEDGLRLISLYGRTNGDLTFAQGYYSDFSGGKREWTFYTSKEDAILKFKELVLKSQISDDILKIAKEYNFKLDKKLLEDYKENRKKSLNGSIEQNNRAIEAYKVKIKELNNL